VSHDNAGRLAIAPIHAHDRALISNVHSEDRVNPEPTPRYNLAVIGAGTGGILGVEKRAAEKIILVECGGERKEIAADEILIGVGRVPAAAAMGLEAARRRVRSSRRD
jgi:pyruvate/2-oxoglutarate dehydrogenase complex dihydrolipoamide dehydrogenase (E3) component